MKNFLSATKLLRNNFVAFNDLCRDVPGCADGGKNSGFWLICQVAALNPIWQKIE